MKKLQSSFRIRFSIQAMLVALLVCAVGFAILARKEAGRRELIATIEAAGGSVNMDESETPLWPFVSVASVSVPYSVLKHFPPGEIETVIRPKQLTVARCLLNCQGNTSFNRYYADLNYK
ncbi:hypothetical protein [Rhodopirellula halodulae]|uniref:hypothetical protein n=1 Tax=Rhodopirellula halodulae TaxID=2894198 RepID=UPI001E452CFD|nr:hypothetical protein [Rhodopirellula sp. JC737]MCC9655132.1 hypothetical protein [Rhodopirellula sp. JC737]